MGLDPRLDSMPDSLLKRYQSLAAPDEKGQGAVAACFEEFCTEVLAAAAPHVVAVKLQLACFEQYGAPGIGVFKHVCERAARAGLLVIADAKRGDIGVSAQAYSSAFLGRPDGLSGKIDGFNADAVTVNPLFGSDGMEPFLKDCRDYGKGVFVLVKTSNPGSAELQDLSLETGQSFYERIAVLVKSWGSGLVGREGYSSVGAVVGATQPQAITRIRELLPRVLFLLPGYGAQGATAADVAPAFDSRGLGAIVSASRSIIYAGSDEDYAACAADAARDMKDGLWAASH